MVLISLHIKTLISTLFNKKNAFIEESFLLVNLVQELLFSSKIFFTFINKKFLFILLNKQTKTKHKGIGTLI